MAIISVADDSASVEQMIREGLIPPAQRAQDKQLALRRWPRVGDKNPSGVLVYTLASGWVNRSSRSWF